MHANQLADFSAHQFQGALHAFVRFIHLYKLLVVLSLLVLFSLVAVTFVLVAGRYYDAARNSVKVEQTGDDPAQYPAHVHVAVMAAYEIAAGAPS